MKGALIMARIIRFPLRMKNGAEVRSLDELKENFDLESILGYFTDGKLQTWLADRYYDEKANEVAALSSDMPNLNAKLCEILEVEYKAEVDVTNLEAIQQRNEKYKILSTVTSDREILNNTEIVAMNQDELYDILDEGTEKVYLCGDRFEIPTGRRNVCYIGINSPLVILENNKGAEIYAEAGIKFKNVQYEGNINPYITIGEKLFLEGKYKEAFPIIEQAANNENPRAMHIMARYYNDGYEVVKINNVERNNWCSRAYSYKEPLSMYGYSFWCTENGSEEQKRICSQIFVDIKETAESGDLFAQGAIGWMYDNGNGVVQDKNIAVKWMMKAAEQCYPYAQNYLGWMYGAGNGVDKDNIRAVEWYRKAAEHGFAAAQYNLGVMYQNGNGVDKDFGMAEHWYLKAAEQDYKLAFRNLANMYDIMYEAGSYANYDRLRQTVKKYDGVLGKLDSSSSDLEASQIVFNSSDERWKCYIRGAKLNDPVCLLKAGFLIAVHGPREYSKEEILTAVEWLKASVDYDPANAYFYLGIVYECGIYEHCIVSNPFVIEPNKRLAIEYYTKGANAGSNDCRAKLNRINQPAKKKSFLGGLFG